MSGRSALSGIDVPAGVSHQPVGNWVRVSCDLQTEDTVMIRKVAKIDRRKDERVIC